jgi:aminopeptidase N
MPSENLTRVDAEARAAIVDVIATEIELDLTRGSQTFGSTTLLRFRATAGATTTVDAITERVHTVRLNGVDLDPAQVSDGVRITLPDLHDENELLVVADARYTNTGEGLHRFLDPVDGEVYLYSQLAVPDARRMFAVFEQPDLKSTFRLTVSAPAHWQVVSNQPTPEPSPLPDGAARWSFAPTPRLSSYLVALVAGPYAVRRGQLTSSDGRRIPLGAFTRKSLEPSLDADEMFAKATAGVAFYEAAFGVPFPFAKYDQLFVPEYNLGAMENAGAVTFTEDFVFRSRVTDAMRETRAMVVLHELAHMWFGDLVTMRWWDDVWLNESFATFVSYLATAEVTEWRDAWASFHSDEKGWAYEQDQLPSTHPIEAEIPDIEAVQVNFDGITYAKGASVLKQLVAYVGREPFLTGVGAYLRRHAWGNATLADLLSDLEAAGGRDLAAWSRAWLRTSGVNTLTPELAEADGVVVRLDLLQTATDDVLRPHRLAVGFYDEQDGRLVRIRRVELDVTGERTSVPLPDGVPVPALLLVNDDDLAYAKVRLDPRSLATARASISRIDDAVARALVWGTIWDATRDAQLPASEFVRIVLDHAAAETVSATLQIVLQHAVLAAEHYVTPDRRAAVLEQLADGLLALARAAEPGSDGQFQLASTFARVARTPAQLDAVRGLADGTAALAGLEVDTDLSWRLLIALVSGGRAGEAEIAAALERDGTAKGRESALEARAALPTADGKAAAWASVVESAALPNAQVRSTTAGFRRALSPALLEPYVDRYFAVIDDLWAQRDFSIAEALARGLYPAPLASRRLADASRRWLDARPEPTALHRIVVENLARVDRALAAQSRDAG